MTPRSPFSPSGLVDADSANLPHLLSLANPPPRIWWQPPGIEFCLVPAGPCRGWPWHRDNHGHPGMSATWLNAFYVAKTPVTNAQFAHYLRAAAYIPERWSSGNSPPGKLEHPVVCISLAEARAFCAWAGCQLMKVTHWAIAALGSAGCGPYPWGSQWQADRCNGAESGIGHTTPVTQFPDGASPYGLLDMVGNIREWTDDPVPYKWPNVYMYNYTMSWSFMGNHGENLGISYAAIVAAHNDLGFRPMLGT